jgi:hypothetical protein
VAACDGIVAVKEDAMAIVLMRVFMVVTPFEGYPIPFGERRAD